jgi:hypothetical protein
MRNLGLMYQWCFENEFLIVHEGWEWHPLLAFFKPAKIQWTARPRFALGYYLYKTVYRGHAQKRYKIELQYTAFKYW